MSNPDLFFSTHSIKQPSSTHSVKLRKPSDHHGETHLKTHILADDLTTVTVFLNSSITISPFVFSSASKIFASRSDENDVVVVVVIGGGSAVTWGSSVHLFQR
jgi:hypothetical protein